MFERALADNPMIDDAWQIAGNLDYLLRVVCREMAELDAVVSWLRRAGAEETVTNFLLRHVSGAPQS